MIIMMAHKQFSYPNLRNIKRANRLYQAKLLAIKNGEVTP